MKRVLKCFAAAACGVLIALSRPQAAFAVDAKPLTIQEKWSVVGVITSSKPENDVAVLRNNETAKTYTVTLGDSLPSEYSFVLTEIKRRNVTISNGETKVILGFVDHPVDDEEDDDFRNSVRFIDNYYRGLADSPIELFNKPRRSDTTGTAAVNPVAVPVMPLKNFESIGEAQDSRFETEETFDPEVFQNQDVYDEGFDADMQNGAVQEDYQEYAPDQQEDTGYYE